MSDQISANSIAVIILTFNEEENIEQALRSVVGWAHQVLVLDSFSTDRTLEIASQFDCQVAQHRFEDYGKQRNYALEQLPVKSEWVLFLDADEWMPPPIRDEISAVISSAPPENGFYLNRRLIWMGRWIRRGYYPSWILRMFRYGKGRCDDRAVNEHMLVEGPVGHLRNDFMHEDRKGVTDWTAKHNAYATREARELLAAEADIVAEDANAKLFGTQPQRKRWLRQKIWNHLPPLLRPFLYFFYRYIVRGGFLDGRPGFVYHFLQGLWYPLLIDVKYLEMRWRVKSMASEPAPKRDQ